MADVMAESHPAEGHPAESHTVAFSTPMPLALDQTIHVRLTTRAKCLMLLVTSTGDAAATPALGSFVYAVPDRLSGDALCTHLYVDEGSLEFAVRLATLAVKRARQPVYVSCSLALSRMGLGGTADEVLAALQAIVTPLLPLLPKPE